MFASVVFDHSLVLLMLVALVSGLINGSVGGGGLVQLPGTLSVLPHEAPATVLGINKFGAVFSNGSSARYFVKRFGVPWRLLAPAMVCALIGSFCGALFISRIPLAVFKPLILVMLIVITVYTFVKKDFGKTQVVRPVTGKTRWGAAALGLFAGFYDGSFGPGVGNLMTFMFVRFFALDFMHALAASRILNFLTNLAALSFFIPAGHIIWHYALAMAPMHLLGGMLGVRIVMKGGIPLIRVLFLTLMIVLIGKMAFDLLSPYWSWL